MHPDDGRVVSNFIVQALRGDPLTLYGDGEQTRSFCYVDDLVEGLIRLMESANDVTGPINLGNPQEFSMRELAKEVLDLTGSASELTHRPLPEDDPTRRRPDISLAKDALGWETANSSSRGAKEHDRVLRSNPAPLGPARDERYFLKSASSFARANVRLLAPHHPGPPRRGNTTRNGWLARGP